MNQQQRGADVATRTDPAPSRTAAEPPREGADDVRRYLAVSVALGRLERVAPARSARLRLDLAAAHRGRLAGADRDAYRARLDALLAAADPHEG